MTKKKKAHRLDSFIDRLAENFRNVPNFHLMQDDPEGKRMFTFIMTKLSELVSMKELFTHYYIPSANKAIVEAKKEIQTSNYKSILDVSDDDLKETRYELIRLGYVSLFHKIEAFIDDLSDLLDDLYRQDDQLELKKYLKVKYQYDLKDWKKDPIVERINWICNCVKHYNGFPKKTPIPESMIIEDHTSKLKFEIDFLKKDMEYVLNSYFNFKLAQLLNVNVFRMMEEELYSESEDENLNQQRKEAIDNFEKLLQY